MEEVFLLLIDLDAVETENYPLFILRIPPSRDNRPEPKVVGSSVNILKIEIFS